MSDDSMSESDGVPHDDGSLVTAEGVNERGTDVEAAGTTPGDPDVETAPETETETETDTAAPAGEAAGGEGATAPGVAVGTGHAALDAAPEPNEPG